jgi:putative sterol carrier protein
MQGKLQVAKALALRKVKVKGSLTAGLRVVAVCNPAFSHYRERVEADYPHLMV